MSKKLLADLAVAALVERERDRATKNVQKFNDGLAKDRIKRVKEIVADYAADLRQAGNRGGAAQVAAMGRDIAAALRS